MPTKPSTKPAEKQIDPQAVMKAIIEETPELKNGLLDKGLIVENDDGTIEYAD